MGANIDSTSIYKVEYDGKTYTCRGERAIVDDQLMWLYKTRNGLDLDTLVCLDRNPENNPVFYHRYILPGRSDFQMEDTVEKDHYLTFTSITGGTLGTHKPKSGKTDPQIELYFSFDGEDWMEWDFTDSITLEPGESIKFRGENYEGFYYNSSNHGMWFVMDGDFNASGDITSIVNGVGGDCALPDYCFYEMFNNCSGLKTAPNLPSTELGDSCYGCMFSGSGITVAPALPATTLADNCYFSMFSSCTSLETVPTLPATTLTENCYSNMFSSCTSLATAPDLPAAELVMGCYNAMFSYCENLGSVKAMFVTENLKDDDDAYIYTGGWLDGVKSNGTFVRSRDAQWTVVQSGDCVPSTWTVEEI